LAAERGGNIGSITRRLLALLDQVGPSELEAAVAQAIEQDVPTIGAVRQILDRRLTERGLPPPVSVLVSPKAAAVTVRNHALTSYDALKKRTDNEQED
jgi:hypothetical protein